jgi:hypothetical protein
VFTVDLRRPRRGRTLTVEQTGARTVMYVGQTVSFSFSAELPSARNATELAG